jgi:hypothetical protein
MVDGSGPPSGVCRTRHYSAAGDDEPHGYRDQAETNDPLPWCIAEPIPQAVRDEVDGARGPEGRKRAGWRDRIAMRLAIIAAIMDP